jgi:inorganic pyrophosphatase
MKGKKTRLQVSRPHSLVHLPVRDPETGAYRAIIETPQGSRNKLKYEPALGIFTLHSVLPLGTAFPYDFGFFPSTLGEDGDPLDVLLFMDEPAPAGSLIPCNVIGVIEAKQTEKHKTERNDRVLAVALHTHRYHACRALSDFATEVLDEIERFFTFYDSQKGVLFTPIGRHGRGRAEKLIAAGAKRFTQAHSGKKE